MPRKPTMIRRTLLNKLFVSRELNNQMERIPKRVGSLGYDPWGFQKEGVKAGIALLKILYDHYFRVEAYGREHIPKDGRLLVIANHSGQIPFDGGLICVAMVTNPGNPRIPRAMIERFFPTVPYVNHLLNQSGAVIGDPVNCVKMLEHEEAVIVFPEGVRGSGKLFRDRYQLQRFGTGFMHIACQTQTPILPVGVVGAEESMPSLLNIKPLARLLQIPYVPLTTPVPFPVKVRLFFGEPMHFSGGVQNEARISENVEEVKTRIRSLIQKGLAMRKGWWR